jgi:hypothetical protein
MFYALISASVVIQYDMIDSVSEGRVHGESIHANNRKLIFYELRNNRVILGYRGKNGTVHTSGLQIIDASFSFFRLPPVLYMKTL